MPSDFSGSSSLDVALRVALCLTPFMSFESDLHLHLVDAFDSPPGTTWGYAPLLKGIMAETIS